MSTRPAPDPEFHRPEPFVPPVWAANPHVQTLAGRLLRAPEPVPLTRERWTTPDGDFLDLDFHDDQGGGVVLVLHGLEGNTRRSYMLSCYRALAVRGLTPVGMNFRSCSGEPNLRPRAYHSGETGDPRMVLRRLRARFPDRRVGAMGISLGGNVLLKLLGEGADPAADPDLPEAAAVVSVPFDLAAGADLLASSTAGRLYMRYFLKSLVGKMEAKRPLLEGLIDLDGLTRVRTLREFDDRATAPIHGFRDADHYYAESSSARYLDGIRVPTLVLHAEDDPFLPARAIPRRALGANPCLYPVIPRQGGHVGFLTSRPGVGRFWAERAVADFLAERLAPHRRTP